MSESVTVNDQPGEEIVSAERLAQMIDRCRAAQVAAAKAVWVRVP